MRTGKFFLKWAAEEHERYLRWPAICDCAHRERFHMWSKSDHPSTKWTPGRC